MCGRLNVIDDGGVTRLCQQLRIPLWPNPKLQRRFVRATEPLAIIRQQGDERTLQEAVWWLLLQANDTGFKPSKYTSFNTRYDKLMTMGSAGYEPFRTGRCIIPAKGFGESEFINKKPLHYHDFSALPGEAIAFGGLYRVWVNRNTGERQLSCSIITIPPHPKLQQYHSKSMPLILPQEQELLDLWLDPNMTDPNIFVDLLQPHLPQELLVQQINKPSEYQALSEPRLINAD